MGELNDLLKQEIIKNNLIFNNINDLATKIADEMKKDGHIKGDDKYIKKQRSVSSFLHQVDNYDRKCTDALSNYISKAITRKLKGQSEQTIANINEKFKKTIESINTKTKSRLKSEDPGIELKELMSWAKKAKSHFIITHKTAESIADYTVKEDEVNDIQKILILRMGLFIGEGGGFQLGENGYEYKYEPETRYFFYLPDKYECIRFWHNLFGLVTGEKGNLSFSNGILKPNEVNIAFQKISGTYIVTYKDILHYPLQAGAIPVVVYNAYEGNGCGFALFYQNSKKVSVAKMDDESFRIWMNKVFYPITSENQKDNIVQWSEAKPVTDQEYNIK
jgi:hypothetical protein